MMDLLPDSVVFGRGCASGVASAVPGRRPLLVCSSGSGTRAAREAVAAALDAAGIDYVRFDGAGSNPKLASIDEGAAAAVSAGCDCVVAVGGGSQLDAGKAMALVAASGGSIRDYTGGRASSPDVKALPVVAVATTCGTGSEVNGICVLTDEVTHDKAGVTSPSVVPVRAFVDPGLMETMPPRVLASVTYDTLCHLVESFMSSASTPRTDEICRRGLECLSEALIPANRGDPDSLSRVAMASTAVGVAIYIAGTTAGHAIEHPLSGLRDIPHGEGLAAVSPAIYRIGHPEVFREAAALLGMPGEGLDSAMLSISRELGLDRPLSDLGFGRDDIPWLTGSAIRNRGSKLSRHPVDLSEADIRRVYEESLRRARLSGNFL